MSQRAVSPFQPSTSSSSTVVETLQQQEEPGSSTLSGPGQADVVRLRLQEPAEGPSSTDHASSRRVRWDEQTVDNEHMGRKKSKCCCIYRKPRAFDESSSEEEEEEGNDGASSGSHKKNPGSKHQLEECHHCSDHS